MDDDDLAGLASQNAGVIAYYRGDLREARALYLESIGSFVRSGNSGHALLTYNNLGLACVNLRDWLEADVYYSRGIEIAERHSKSPLLAKLYGNRAEALIHIGEIQQARDSLDRAKCMAPMSSATASRRRRCTGAAGKVEGIGHGSCPSAMRHRKPCDIVKERLSRWSRRISVAEDTCHIEAFRRSDMPLLSNSAHLIGERIRMGIRFAGYSSRRLMTAAFVALSVWVSVSIAVVAGYASASVEVAIATSLLTSAVLTPCAALLARRRGLRVFFLGSYDDEEKRLDDYLRLVETAQSTLSRETADAKADKLFDAMVKSVENP